MKKNKLLQTLLGIAILAALVSFVGVDQVLSVFQELTLPIILYLFFLSLILIFVSSLKWKVFLEADGEKSNLGYLFVLYIVAYFVNLLVPSFVGGDVVRSWYVGKRRAARHSAFAATVLERYTGFVAMIGMALLSLWFVPDVPNSVVALVIGLSFAIVTGTYFCLSPKLLKFGRRLLSKDKVWQEIETFQSALRFLGKNRNVMIEAMGLSLVFHLVAVGNAIAAAYAVGWDSVPILQMLVVVPIVLVIGAIPIAPAGLGLQEGAFFFFLTMIGASPAEAVGVGLILRAKNYVIALLGGILWFVIHSLERSRWKESQ